MTKYALDTNVYVDCFRNVAAGQALKYFLATHLMRTYMLAVVVQELRAGTSTGEQIKALESGVLAPFERRNRIMSPSSRAFQESGRILAQLAVKDKLDLVKVAPSFPNDTLIAASCRELGIILITRDVDFKRIAPHIPGFRYIPPPF